MYCEIEKGWQLWFIKKSGDEIQFAWIKTKHLNRHFVVGEHAVHIATRHGNVSCLRCLLLGNPNPNHCVGEISQCIFLI